jgi:uncharacterized protein YggE
MKTKILYSILAFSFLFMAKAQDYSVKQRTITITGSAEMEIIPDQIDVQINLREYTKKGAAKTTIETIKNNFLKACKSIGLTEKEISVQSLQGNDNNYWFYKKQKKQNPDMNAGISYIVRLSTASKIEELVNILDDEATENFFIAKVSHSKMNELKKQLKIEAVKAAKEKANYLAEAIGEHVGEAITINDPVEMNNNYPRPMYSNMLMKTYSTTDASKPELDVDFKKINLQFSVTVVFALK